MVLIHFLNIGYGDCSIVKLASGRISMIDINNGEELDQKSLHNNNTNDSDCRGY